MTGPEHYAEAERYLKILDVPDLEHTWLERVSSGELQLAMATAQVHATLALAAATALGTDQYRSDSAMWRHVAMTPFEPENGGNQ